MADPVETPVGAIDYTRYRNTSRFTYTPGVFVLPLASRTPKTITVRAHAGFGTRTVNFSTSKRGSPPILPNAKDTDQDTLIAATVTMPLPAPDAHEGTYIWIAEGEYIFITRGEGKITEDGQTVVQRGPRIPGESYFPTGAYPFEVSLQKAVADALAPDGNVVPIAEQIPALLPINAVQWPFTVYPPQLFNEKLLRDDYVGIRPAPEEEP